MTDRESTTSSEDEERRSISFSSTCYDGGNLERKLDEIIATKTGDICLTMYNEDILTLPKRLLKRITKLIVDAYSIANVDMLKQCPKLEYLDIGSCRQLDDLTPLTRCDNLEILVLTGAIYLTSFKGIEQCSKLKYLNLSGNSVAEIDDLISLTQLEIVLLSACDKLSSL